MRKLQKFNQPPFAVTESLMYDLSKITSKLNRKNGFYRVLGKRALDAESSIDKEIFEERDLANDILHELMSNSFGESLTGAARVIQERLLKRKKQNTVDRKASKDRKLKYEIHEKLINFMSGHFNIEEMDGRDQIVENLFGVARKKVKTGNVVEDEVIEENDIELF